MAVFARVGLLHHGLPVGLEQHRGGSSAVLPPGALVFGGVDRHRLAHHPATKVSMHMMAQEGPRRVHPRGPSKWLVEHGVDHRLGDGRRTGGLEPAHLGRAHAPRGLRRIHRRGGVRVADAVLIRALLVQLLLPAPCVGQGRFKASGGAPSQFVGRPGWVRPNRDDVAFPVPW